MLPITNKINVLTLDGMVMTLVKDEWGLYGSISQPTVKVYDNKCTCFLPKSIKRNTFSDGLREQDVLAKNEAINQYTEKKKDLSQTQISHWIVNCDWGRKGRCINDCSCH